MKYPIHRSLIKPPTIMGMPRNPALMLGAFSLFLGFQQGQWVAAILLFVIVGGFLALIMKLDWRLPEIIVRSFRRSPSNHLRK